MVNVLNAPLALEWTGVEDFPNAYIQARLVTGNNFQIGPYEANVVGDNGISAVSEGYSAKHKWTILSWVDANNNFECDDDVDIMREYDLPLGVTVLSMEYDASVTTSGICNRMSEFINYEPPPQGPYISNSQYTEGAPNRVPLLFAWGSTSSVTDSHDSPATWQLRTGGGHARRAYTLPRPRPAPPSPSRLVGCR